jgi:RNA polymerase sigma factor (sigma-70 family)
MSIQCRVLVRAAVAGERTAGRTLEQRLHPVIERSVRRVLRRSPGENAIVVADLVQDAWVFLLEDGARRLTAYEPARGVPLESYVAVLVMRRTINELVRRSAKKRCPVELVCTAPASDPERAVLCADLIATIAAELPPRAARVLESVYVRGMSPADAALVLGVNIQVVRNWQLQIRRFAQKHFGRQL